MNITCGVTPHHLLWTEEKLKDNGGLLYKMNPPLRKTVDVEYLRHALKDGLIDWVETDHAPHAVGEKLHTDYPSGYPSLYLYKELVERMLPMWEFGDQRIEDITCNNIVKTFNLTL